MYTGLMLLLLLVAANGCLFSETEKPSDDTSSSGTINNSSSSESDDAVIIPDTTYLYRDREPYHIKGGFVSTLPTIPTIAFLTDLKNAGANSFHIGYDSNSAQVLDMAQELGMTVTVSFYIESHIEDVDFGDSVAVQEIFDRIIAGYEILKNKPAAFIWSIGYDIDLEDGNTFDPRVIDVINDLGKTIHAHDSSQYVATMISHGQASTIEYFQTNGPEIDIISIGSFDGAVYILRAVKKLTDKVLMLGNFSYDGWWNHMSSKGYETSVGTKERLKQLSSRYNFAASNPTRIAGSYVGGWVKGQYWWDLFDTTGAASPYVDQMTYLWSGNYPDNRAPVIEDCTIGGFSLLLGGTVGVNEVVSAHIEAVDENGDSLTADWELYYVGTHDERLDSALPLFTHADTTLTLDFTVEKEGMYWLGITVKDGEKSNRGFYYLSANRTVTHAPMGAIPVEVKAEGEGFTLYREGNPYYIKGAGAPVYPNDFKNYGGNSLRNWGMDAESIDYLDRAYADGNTVMQGIWILHEEHGFDYDDSAAVQDEFDRIKEKVLLLKDHPALLMWGVGNEVDLGLDPDTMNKKVWSFINDIAAMIHEVDSLHPVSTIITSTRCVVVEDIIALAPEVDILSINAYAALGPSLNKYEECGWTKSVIVTEYGVRLPIGEAQKTRYSMPIEESSKVKAAVYTERYALIEADPRVLGSYVFVWDSMIDQYSKWYSIVPSDTGVSEIVDAMTFHWTGSYPEHRSPSVSSLTVGGFVSSDFEILTPSTEYAAVVNYENISGDSLRFEWQLFDDSNPALYDVNTMLRAPQVGMTVVDSTGSTLTLTTPEQGSYKLVCFVYDTFGNVGYANFQFGLQ